MGVFSRLALKQAWHVALVAPRSTFFGAIACSNSTVVALIGGIQIESLVLVAAARRRWGRLGRRSHGGGADHHQRIRAGGLVTRCSLTDEAQLVICVAQASTSGVGEVRTGRPSR